MEARQLTQISHCAIVDSLLGFSRSLMPTKLFYRCNTPKVENKNNTPNHLQPTSFDTPFSI